MEMKKILIADDDASLVMGLVLRLRSEGFEVITAVDENVDTTRCGGAQNCQDNERCLTHDLWRDLSDRIYDYLNRISLHDLMTRRGVQQVAERQDDNGGLAVALVPMQASGQSG